MKMTLSRRVAAVLTAASITLGGAVLLAEPASAVPHPIAGRACPSGDSDLILGGAYVQKWSLVRQVTTTLCGYNTKTCTVGWIQSCFAHDYVLIRKTIR